MPGFCLGGYSQCESHTEILEPGSLQASSFNLLTFFEAVRQATSKLVVTISSSFNYRIHKSPRRTSDNSKHRSMTYIKSLEACTVDRKNIGSRIYFCTEFIELIQPGKECSACLKCKWFRHCSTFIKVFLKSPRREERL
jgi:hypothetical protein